jgi:hypothetical protein
MRLASHLRKLAYPAILIVLSLAFTASASAQTLTQTGAPKYIGVDAYSAPTWAQVGESGSKYYAGVPKSEKFFYKNGLPDSDAAKTSNHVPGCGARSGGSYVYPEGTLCIIVYNKVKSSDTNLQDFLDSTVGDQHQIILIFCNEPDNGIHDNGCVCSLPSYSGPCMDRKTKPAINYFLPQFEQQSQAVKNFENEKVTGTPNVAFGEDSWAGHYESGTGGCAFIAPPQYVSYYLVDVYEGRGKSPITQPESLGQDPGWENWISCTNGLGRDRGIAEFAINCGHEQKSLDHGAYEKAVAQSFSEDDTYLRGNFDLEVWNLWDSGNCALNNKPKQEPGSIAAWQTIESGN